MSARDSNAAPLRLCDVKGCGKEATERVVEREKPNIGVPVCATHAFALTLGDFYVREAGFAKSHLTEPDDYAEWDANLLAPRDQEPEREAERDRYRDALEKIAAGPRPDGTYNLSREACEQLAREALDVYPS